jgi:hypothetical protein
MISARRFQLVNLQTYAQTIMAHAYGRKVPLCRVFVINYQVIPGTGYTDSGFNLVVNNSAGVEYDFMRQGLKKKRIIKTVYSGSVPHPPQVCTCKAGTYWIERVMNIDSDKNEVEIEMNEV